MNVDDGHWRAPEDEPGEGPGHGFKPHGRITQKLPMLEPRTQGARGRAIGSTRDVPRDAFHQTLERLGALAHVYTQPGRRRGSSSVAPRLREPGANGASLVAGLGNRAREQLAKLAKR